MGGVVIPTPEAGPVSLYYWDGSAWQKWLGTPLTTGAQLYYWDGAAWQKWTGNPSSMISQGYVWDGAAWQKAKGDADGHVQVDVLSQPSPTTVQQTTPANLTSLIYGNSGGIAVKVGTWPSGALFNRRTPPACAVSNGGANSVIYGSAAVLYWATFSNYDASLTTLCLRDNGVAGLVRWACVFQGTNQLHCVFDPPINFSFNIWFTKDVNAQGVVTCGYDPA